MTLKNDWSKSIEPLASHGSEAFQLGDANIKPSLNRIEIATTVYQIEPKVMQALMMLCARPGHVVLRDELLKQVWGPLADGYLLNRAISELRKIFADSVQHPKYIETIRKTGYRVVAPIKPAASAALATSSPNKPKKAEPTTAFNHSTFSGLLNALTVRYTLIIAALVFGIGFFTVFLSKNSSVGKDRFNMAGYQVYPATSAKGREYQPALSPDGSRLAYVKDNLGASKVFVKMIQGQEQIELSTTDLYAQYPNWTADGQRVVYANFSSPVLEIKSVSPLGGPQRIIHRDKQAFGLRGMGLSPQGNNVVYAKRPSINAPYQIWMQSTATGDRRQLTFPQSGSLGDIDPLFTPDGNALMFVRGSDEVTKDIYSLDLSSMHLKRLTFDNRKINGITWSPNGTHLLFTSTRSGLYRLWSINKNGGEPQPMALGLESIQRPTTALGVEAVVFEDWKHSAKLIEIHLTDSPNVRPLTHSTRWDSSPSISADGKTVAFVSNRQGSFAIWLSDLESGKSYEWFSLGGAFIDNPSWSPNDTQIIFDANETGRSQIYLIDRGSTVPQKLSLGPGENRAAAWSRDGRWVYFESNRNGSWQLFAWQVESGKVQKLNLTGGKNPQESLDGKWIVFTAPNGDGLWRCNKANCIASLNSGSDQPSNSKTAELLIANLQQQDAANWTVSTKGIYFINRPEDSISEIAFYRYATRQIEKILTLPGYSTGWGMVITPDESRLVLTELEQLGSDIKIAKP